MRAICQHADSWVENRSPRVVFHFASVNASGEHRRRAVVLPHCRQRPNGRKWSYQASVPLCGQRFAIAIVLGSSLELVSRLPQGLRGFRNMRRMEARFKNVRPLRFRYARPSWVARSVCVALVATSALIGVAMQRAIADTLEDALVLAYQNNPQINSQRAATRATDEGVRIALSAHRPKVTASAQTGEQYLDSLSKQSIGNGYSRSAGAIAVTRFGVNGSQTPLNGFQTANRTRPAHGQGFAQRDG